MKFSAIATAVLATISTEVFAAGSGSGSGSGSEIASPSDDCQTRARQNINLCLALDMSGSVCSPSFFSTSCDNCAPWCRDNSVDENTCCPNFKLVKDFSTAVVNSLTSDTMFSVVQFATTATQVVGLYSPAVVTLALQGLDYSGGYTNHAEAITACQQTFASSPDPSRKNIILLVTDGVATRPASDPYAAAISAANSSKSAGTVIYPVFIASDDQQQIDYVAELSSDGEVVDVTNFDDLSSNIEDLVSEIKCPEPPVPPDCRLSVKHDINLCFALDMSGSVCSPSLFSTTCDGCSWCRDNSVDENTCCPNFNLVKDFSTAVVNSLTNDTIFSVVQFATTASQVIGLSSPAAVTPVLQGLDYSGGQTNHAEAIAACQQTFASSTDPGRKNITLLVTDGIATRPQSEPQAAAISAANSSKSAGTVIYPVFIDSENQQQIDYVAELSSDGEVVDVSNFDDLSSIIEALVSEITCPESPSCPTSFDPVPEDSRLTFWSDDFPSSAVVRRGFNESGWTLVADPDDAHVVYTFLPVGDTRSGLETWQRYNHNGNSNRWNHKDNFHSNMMNYKSATGRQLWAIPTTYQLNDQDGRDGFRQVLSDEGGINRDWVLKIPNLDRGQGITMLGANTTELRDVVDFVEADTENRYIIQEYICNQMTIDGCRFDIRAYWYVASLCPLVVLFHPGSVRIATDEEQCFDDGPDDWRHPKQSAPASWETLAYHLNLQKFSANFSGDALRHVEEQMMHSLAEFVDAFKDISFSEVSGSAAQNAFGFYCADFIVDDDLDVHFIEPQRGCSMHQEEDEFKRELNDDLTRGVAAIQELISDKQARGERLDSESLEQAGGSDYEVIYNEDEGIDGFMFQYSEYQRGEKECEGEGGGGGRRRRGLGSSFETETIAGGGRRDGSPADRNWRRLGFETLARYLDPKSVERKP